MKGRILFADNLKRFVNVRSEFLTTAGYDVIPAYTIDEAEKILDEKWVHMAILDIRMKDDNDDLDVSGLNLAKNKKYAQIPKIMLTGHPSYEAVREALRPDDLTGPPPAIEFLAKQEKPQVMVTAVERAFERYVRINRDLLINWDGSRSFLQFISQISSGLEEALLLDRSSELEDLFRRLFFDYDQITVGRPITQEADKLTLTVFAFAQDRVEQRYLVAFGARNKINTDVERYDEYVRSVADGSMAKELHSETTHFAAIAYNLPVAGSGEQVTLAAYFRSHPLDRVTETLRHLFYDLLGQWYQTGRFMSREKNLYQFFLEWFAIKSEVELQAKLQTRFESLCEEAVTANLLRIDYSPHLITVYGPDGSTTVYRNPLKFLSELGTVFDKPVLCGTTYGHLNENTALIDPDGQVRLIDFSRLSRGPLIRDFVSLEVAIKYNFLTTGQIKDRYTLERTLAAATSLDETFDANLSDPELLKAMHTISYVRQAASKILNEDIEAYLGGVLFYTFNLLAKFDPEVRHPRRELVATIHGLLSVLILCQRILPLPDTNLPDEANTSLWIDETNHEVWIEGQSVSLTSQEFGLLLYLYKHQGQLCRRSDIIQHVFDVDYGPDTSEWEQKRIDDTRLNSTMSRLRKKVEPHAEKYIAVIRGEGYRLTLNQ
ncbi:MAG: winged helix-turn-helix domain-containing protein [Anaerolineae bacterium]|nr:winged helix-turn-helix domain-containing protein [Anaerolineae bacterium]